MNKIDIVIPFCTYDKKFIQHAIDNIKIIANDIIVVYSNKLFDGTEEDIDYIENLILKNSDCKFIKNYFNKNETSRWNHNNCRWVGIEQTKSDYIMFLNADEIFEKQKIYNWLESKIRYEDIMYFSNYWYFRDTRFQSKVFEETPVIVKKSIIDKSIMFTEHETNIFKYLSIANKSRNNVYFDNKPMCHHYSWVLTKKEMMQKVKSWGHNKDRNWIDLVNKEFESEFTGTDFVHNYEYNILEKGYI